MRQSIKTRKKRKQKLLIWIIKIPKKLFGRFGWCRKLMWIRQGRPMVHYKGFH